MEWMFLPLKRYAQFSGRSRRKEFWMFILFTTIVSMILAGPTFFSIMSASVADPMAVDADPFAGVGTLGMAGLGLYGLFALAVLIPSIAVTVRRLHDRDMSGWWYLGFIVGGMIPLIGFLISIGFIVVMALPGTEGANRFGPDPKDPHGTEVFE
ncbi:DUF805 domain-containing protein [Erythrobacter sp. SCSIO 43205]|uniref:DUF805 domain-containing protein n=1 Tax=Erythrobacter sp. SCSIO 43205 TaxID=2779361 RepID=UPI001CA7CF06|nr:DUF805 domain-containing protein [Erythrobacter sp. SCSIO 43205]UAB77592.1 DUF805 domain-containing protein [Erythrobacter sp. SCSIO 43205]